MPETRETAASGKVAKSGFDAAQQAGADLTVQAIVADASASEAEAEDAPERAQTGLAYQLEPTSTVVRGSESHQTPIYPEVMAHSVNNYPPVPYPPTLKNLVLSEVHATHRGLILNFTTLYFMILYLTHTSVQWYTRARWETGIMSVTKQVRKFRVGMALIFQEYVLAFVTIDLLFQPIWKTSFAEFRVPPNVYTATTDFLVLVADWIRSENFLAGRKYVLACEAIRRANKIWYGIGVYTVMELFFMAGLSPFLTVCELFSSPSRTARFLAAYYTFIHHSENHLWKLLRPCIHDGVLAPTTEQRLKYADWLYVWGKERVMMSNRMAELVDHFNVKSFFLFLSFFVLCPLILFGS
ncbi:hypothetical protein R3P38DRAFT_3609030 [Favolaschia claudopus]|uniref:Gustatory receptor n=1 Tax=Favolaschia claudopus TaxID=2862362 RepID=A0AAW0A814_9AGAR